jgi:hypothetical protein
MTTYTVAIILASSCGLALSHMSVILQSSYYFFSVPPQLFPLTYMRAGSTVSNFQNLTFGLAFMVPRRSVVLPVVAGSKREADKQSGWHAPSDHSEMKK